MGRSRSHSPSGSRASRLALSRRLQGDVRTSGVRGSGAGERSTSHRRRSQVIPPRRMCISIFHFSSSVSVHFSFGCFPPFTLLCPPLFSSICPCSLLCVIISCRIRAPAVRLNWRSKEVKEAHHAVSSLSAPELLWVASRLGMPAFLPSSDVAQIRTAIAHSTRWGNNLHDFKGLIERAMRHHRPGTT